MWYLIPILVILFVLVHLAKMARLYLVLMEHKISLRRFILLYCKTTFVNLFIPFKIGELYRIYKIKKETKHWQVGVLSVVIDRFFDILALFLILLPIDIYFKKQISFHNFKIICNSNFCNYHKLIINNLLIYSRMNEM